ncbi:hypothetical protein VTH06DRAFT_7656, partial [Thermothelomyces fergusii]
RAPAPARARARTLRDALELVGRALGRAVAVEEFASDEDAVADLTQHAGYPAPVARYVVRSLKRHARPPTPEEAKEREEAAANIVRYGGGKEPGRLVDWLEANRARFLE